MSYLARKASSAIIKAVTPNIVNRANASNYYIVAGRPRVRVSFPEKVCHGIAMLVGIYAIPVYILLHIKEYRQ